MQKITISFLLVAAFVLPFVHADPALGYDGAISPLETGYVVTQTDQFFVPLHAGDTIRVDLTWWDANADLDARFVSPGGACAVTPSPDVNCLAANRVPSGVPTCAYEKNAPFIAGQTSESYTKTAKVTGQHEVDVQAAWVSPASGSVSYHLEIYVNGVQRDISGDAPTSINYIHSTDVVACHALP